MLATLIIAYVVIAVVFLAALALAAGQPIPQINPAELMDESLFRAATGAQSTRPDFGSDFEHEATAAATEEYHPVAS